MIAFKNELNVDHYEFPTYNNKEVYLEDFLEKNLDNRFEIVRPDIKLDTDKITSAINKNKPIKIGIINKGGQGERIYSPKGHAIALSANGGGAASKTGAYYIDGKVRKLSPRECARIQGFPDTFKIPVSDGQAWKQFGNSIPINVLRTISADISFKNLINFNNTNKVKFEKNLLPSNT